MTTLISFLGKGQATGYRSANYRFSPDSCRKVPFFGMALAEHIRSDRLLLVGTPGSMWDVFFEHESAHQDESLLHLIDAVGANSVTPALLQDHAARLSAQLGYPVDCVLIDYARDEAEQADLLGSIAEKLSDGERIALDVTHSFRHLPMLALVAARFLTRVRNIQVDDIYYGAFEMKDAATDEVPVLRLKGMLDMLDWVDALAIYDRNGDFSVFAQLFEGAGAQDAAEQLRKAAFFERTNQIGQARAPLREFRAQEAISTNPMFRLFKAELDKRTDWIERKTFTERQEELAEQHLVKGDYLRAASLGFESIVSRLVQSQQGRDPMNYDHRKSVKDELDGEIRTHGRARTLTPAQTAYRDLRELRNTLAHGSRSSFAEIQRVCASEPELHAFLLERLKLVRSL
jgi:CRISPR-associated Csx2 family protein